MGGGMLKRIAKKILKTVGVIKEIPAAPPGYINPQAFTATIEAYRKRGTKIGEGVRLLGQIVGINPHLVSIGDYTVVGVHSALLAHCPIKGPGPCTVGNFVYLAYGVLVLPGVTIGDYCIIGAGSVVTKDIPANSIVAGNPARVLRQLKEEENRGFVDAMKENRKIGFDTSVLGVN